MSVAGGAGGEVSLEILLKELQPRIRSVFARYRIPPQDAEDLLQQTLLIYLHKCESVYDPANWLIGALRNRCLLYWRSRRRQIYSAVDKAILESVAGAQDVPPQESIGFFRDLNRLLAELPARCRKIFKLRYREGYNPTETADRLGYKASSIYKITERCLASLTNRLVACGLVEKKPRA